MNFDRWIQTPDGRLAFTLATMIPAALTALRMAFEAGTHGVCYVEPKEWFMETPEGLVDRVWNRLRATLHLQDSPT